jgi:zinc protease
VASIALFVPSGRAMDPPERAGLASITANVLTKGTTTRNALEIAETIEGVGGSLNAGATDDWLSINASVLAEHLPLAFDLLADVTRRPTFPPEEVELTRRRTLSGLQAQLGQPGAIAQRRFVREVYGAEHPYGVVAVPGTVQGLQRADLEAFYRQHFTPDRALLVVAGAVDRVQVEEMARRHFGDWERRPAPPPAFPQPPAREGTTVYLVHRPGSVQSDIWVGHTGVRPDHPDYFPLQVMNQVLGGGAESRLNIVLREERGWTYGAFSRFTRPRDVGFFLANAEVRPEVTDSALVEMLSLIRTLRDQPVPPEQFEAATSFLAGSFPLRIETPGQIASQVAQARLLGVPVEMVTEYPTRIREVTPADVQRVAREHLRPDHAVIVIVADAIQVLPMVEGIAPVVLYDVEGQLLDPAGLQPPAAATR